MNKKKIIASIVLNLIIFVSNLAAMTFFLFHEDTGASIYGATALRYFTNLSNIYCAIICLALAIYEILMLAGKKEKIPQILLILKQTGTVAVAVTFFTVLFFLAPFTSMSWEGSYVGWIFPLHCSSPLLAMISFLLLEKQEPLTWKQDLFAVIPVLLYGIVYLLQVVVFQTWKDFYGFTFGGQPWAPFVVLPVMLIATYLVSFLLSTLQKKIDIK